MSDDPSNQIPADDKKHIDAKKAAGYQIEVIKHDGEDGQAPQPVDIFLVTQVPAPNPTHIFVECVVIKGSEQP